MQSYLYSWEGSIFSIFHIPHILFYDNIDKSQHDVRLICIFTCLLPFYVYYRASQYPLSKYVFRLCSEKKNIYRYLSFLSIKLSYAVSLTQFAKMHTFVISFVLSRLEKSKVTECYFDKEIGEDIKRIVYEVFFNFHRVYIIFILSVCVACKNLLTFIYVFVLGDSCLERKTQR